MPYPFTRPAEARNRGHGTPGVVVEAGGRRWFYPGGTPEVALALAAAGPVPLDDPGTRVEFGTRDGAAWAAEQVLRGEPRGE